MDWHIKLVRSIHNDSLEDVKTCLNHGVDPNGAYLYGIKPLHLAIQLRRRHIVELLIKGGADVNLKAGLYSQRPLQIAIVFLNIDMVRLLLIHNADIHPFDDALLPTSSKKRSVIAIRKLLKNEPYIRQYNLLLNIVIAMIPLQLPPYVLLWITDYNENVHYLNESQKITMIQRIFNTYSNKINSTKM